MGKTKLRGNKETGVAEKVMMKGFFSFVKKYTVHYFPNDGQYALCGAYSPYEVNTDFDYQINCKKCKKTKEHVLESL